MKDFLSIILLIIVYLILVALFGTVIEVLLYLIFNIELNQGPFKNVVLIISWILPYFLIIKIKKYFNKATVDNEVD
jgi:ABC-type sugar transport system permease subunit